MTINKETKKDIILKNMSFGNYREYYHQQVGELSPANSAGWVQALCPFHADTNPSLQINFLKQGAYKCFSCGESGDIFKFHQKKHNVDFKETLSFFADFLNIDFEDKTVIKKAKKTATKRGKPVAIYQYRDTSGVLICEKLKYLKPKKTYLIRRPDKKNKKNYIWSIKGIPEIPYNLKAISAASVVYIVEGEKDADTLISLKLPATTNISGAESWADSLNQYFINKTVIIIPDNDEPGQKHANLVAQGIKSVAKAIKIVNLPGLQPKGDVTDYIESGKTKKDLLAEIEKTETYEDFIDVLNKKHAVIMLGGRCRILNISKELSTQNQISFSAIRDFYNRYSNQRIPNPLAGQRGQNKTLSIAKEWMKAPERREFSDIVFSPGQETPSDVYNLWSGFAVEPIQGNWNLYRDHIKNVIAGGNNYTFKWIMSWMARIIQDPGGHRPGTSIVLRGGQGTGKGCFASIFGRLLGRHFLQINNQHQLIGRFNSHLQNIILLFVDEGFWGGNKAGEGVIKGLVTEKHLTIENKGENAYTIDNHLNLIMASNSEWVVPSGLDERRFFTIDISEKHQQDKKYFDAIFKQMDGAGCSAMFYDLLHYDREAANIDISTFPKTTAVMSQVIETMTPVQSFWYETLRNGDFVTFDGTSYNKNTAQGWQEKSQKISSEKVYQAFITFCDTRGFRFKSGKSIFGKTLKILCPNIEKSQGTEMLADGTTRRFWQYNFPVLYQCQEDFSEKVKINIDWDSDENLTYDVDL